MSSTNNDDAGGQKDTSKAAVALDSGYISSEELEKLEKFLSKKSQPSENTIDEDRQRINDELKIFKKNTEDRFSDIETLTKAILFVGIISLVGVVVAVIAIVVGQMQFNNATYDQRKTYNEQRIDSLKEEVQTLKDKR